jgi:hypothetical protein
MGSKPTYFNKWKEGRPCIDELGIFLIFTWSSRKKKKFISTTIVIHQIKYTEVFHTTHHHVDGTMSLNLRPPTVDPPGNI